MGVDSKAIYINGELLSLSSDLTLLTTDNLLAADGTDASAAMAVSTLYAIYASNSSASYAPSDLRASATTPTYDS